jgi:rfaE bifunctional protein kinase chain/domain
MAVPDFSGLRVAVVGDLIADHYLFASPRRLSREAPVMVLSHEGEEIGAGGAANVARNLQAMGASVRCSGIVGRDANGRELLRVLESGGVDVAGAISLPNWTTPTKTRVLAAEPRRSLRQVLRIDREPKGAPSAEVVGELATHIHSLAAEVDAIVVSDYEYGAVSGLLGEVARDLAAAGTIVVLDPRQSVRPFAGVTAMTPNVGELSQFTGVSLEALEDPDVLAQAATDMLREIEIRWLLVTCGNRGMVLFGEGLAPAGASVAATGAGEVTDVCGAGDTAASVFALALAAGQSATEAMVLANAASGVVVMEHGAAVCSPDQLAAALRMAPQSIERMPRTKLT